MPQTLPNPLVQAGAANRVRAGSADRAFDAPVLLGLWHLTSIDAPTVAVVWSLGFAWAAGVRLPVWIPVLLALAAWTVYIVDRLLDANTALRSSDLSGLRERHRFHYRHRRALIPVAIAAACAAICIVFTFMPWAARERDSILGLAAVAYFARVHAPRTPAGGLPCLSRLLRKEMLVGLLFTAACALPAISRAAPHISSVPWPVFGTAALFTLLAWLNCHAIDRWEVGEHEKGKLMILVPACLLAFAGLMLAAILSSTQTRPAALVVAGAVSALLLALLDGLRGRFTPLALRTYADLVLLAPLVLILR
ncbi:MAG: hypothetical protein ABSG96_07105 [Terracidiphilus sp.]